MIHGARLTDFNQDSGHGFLGNASQANGAAKRTAFNQAANHFGAVFNAQFVHGINMHERSSIVNNYLAIYRNYLDKLLDYLDKSGIKWDMSNGFDASIKDRHEAGELSIAVGKVFQPRAPISTRELFAGRWEQCTAIVDAVNQKGLHVVIFGERGVGKTSLANVLDPLLAVMEADEKTHVNPNPRLVVKVNVHQGDSFPTVWNCERG